MIKLINKWRISRLERKIAFFQARLSAYKELVNAGFNLGCSDCDDLMKAHQKLTMAYFDLATLHG